MKSAAWLVVGAMLAELRRQAAISTLTVDAKPDIYGRVTIQGPVDLAALASATEAALRETLAHANREGSNGADPSRR